jgi:hypothetical protein
MYMMSTWFWHKTGMAGLWDAIELRTNDYREDRNALAALL